MTVRADCKHLERKDVGWGILCADCLKVLMPLIDEHALFFATRPKA